MLWQTWATEHFFIVPCVQPGAGVRASTEGNLVITVDSISFIPPALPEEYAPPPDSKEKSFLTGRPLVTLLLLCILGVVSVGTFEITKSPKYGQLLLAMLLFLFAALGLVSVISFFLRRRKSKLSVEHLDITMVSREWRRSLYEQILASNKGVEEKVRSLARYRKGSVRIPRQAMRSLSYSGMSNLNIIGQKKEYSFKIPKQFYEGLNTALLKYGYVIT